MNALNHAPDFDYAFAVCRIVPENNLDIVLEAFDHQELSLIVVGNWDKSDYGRALREKYKESKNIYLLDPIYNIEKLNQLRMNCTFYIHGHSCGGTNPSLVEAMYLGLAIVSFDVNFNRETTENSALFFSDSASLRKIIQTYTPEQMSSISQKMKEIANRRYTWERIGNRYEYFFNKA